jgi:hypothetical protein
MSVKRYFKKNNTKLWACQFICKDGLYYIAFHVNLAEILNFYKFRLNDIIDMPFGQQVDQKDKKMGVKVRIFHLIYNLTLLIVAVFSSISNILTAFLIVNYII